MPPLERDLRAKVGSFWDRLRAIRGSRVFGSGELARLRADLHTVQDREADLRQRLHVAEEQCRQLTELHRGASDQHMLYLGRYQVVSEQHKAAQEQHRLVSEQHRAVLEQYQAASEEIRLLKTPPLCPDPANQLFFLFSLPKSAGQALRAMLVRCWRGGAQGGGEVTAGAPLPPSLSCPNGLHVELPLTDAVLADFPAGGWYHYHAPATLITLDFLHRHRVRHVVLVRHPLDQVVAYYCHIVKHRRLGHRVATPWGPGLALTNPQAPVPAAAFAGETPPDRAFDLLIRSGYLEAALTWTGQWAAFRSPALSLFLTYEELVGDPAAVLGRAVEFLRPMLVVPEGGVGQVVGALGEYAQFSRDLEAKSGGAAYPRGYTGRVGVYRDYLSDDNIAAARAVYEKFCRESEYGPLVRAVYPTL